MPTNTTNYGIVKPDLNETADIGVINSNMDIIDSALAPTADPAQVPTGLSGKLSQWVSWIANRIKAITGKTNWYDAPSKTLEDLNTHLSDNTKQIPHLGTTTNSGDAYSITTTEVINANEKFTIKFNAASTTAPTLNINSGAISGPVKKANGNNAKLYASIYTLFWDGTNFIQLGEGGEYGTATADKVLSPYTIGTDNGLVNGSMTNNGAVTITPNTADQTIAQGYHNGSGKVKGDTNLAASNIKKNTSIFGVTGTLISKYTIKTGLSTNDLYMNSVDANGNTYYYETGGPAYPKAFKCDANGTLVNTVQTNLSYSYMRTANENGVFWTNSGNTAGYHYDWSGTLIHSLTGQSSFTQFTKMNNKYYLYTSAGGGISEVYDANMTYLHLTSGTWAYNAYWFTIGDNQIYEITQLNSNYDTKTIAKLDTSTDAGATMGFPQGAYALIVATSTLI